MTAKRMKASSGWLPVVRATHASGSDIAKLGVGAGHQGLASRAGDARYLTIGLGSGPTGEHLS